MTTQKEKEIYVHTFLDQCRGTEESRLEKPKSRVSSLSSLFSSSMQDDGKHEVFGFRRFAKSYLYGSGKPSKSCGSKFSNKYQVVDGTALGKGGRFAAIDLPQPSIIKSKKRSSQDKVEYIFNLESIIGDNLISSDTKKMTANGGEHTVLYGLPGLFKAQGRAPLVTEGQTLCIDDASEKKASMLEGHRTAIAIPNIPRDTGIGSILSQVCGGPLACIKEYREGLDGRLRKLGISFISPKSASSFMKYGHTNLFKINGIHITPEWIESDDINFAELNNFSSEEYSDVCRCLILKKYFVSNARQRNSDTTKVCLPDDLDVDDIKKDFSNYGDILDITPVVSRKLCISINFYSIESSIKAMFDYEDSGSYLHNKYSRTWAAWYGKDTTDRPCVQL